MDATNVIFHVSVLGLRRKQEVFGSRKRRTRLETGAGWQHGWAYHVLLDLAKGLILLSPAGGIAGFVGNPGGEVVCCLTSFGFTQFLSRDCHGQITGGFRETA